MLAGLRERKREVVGVGIEQTQMVKRDIWLAQGNSEDEIAVVK